VLLYLETEVIWVLILKFGVLRVLLYALFMLQAKIISVVVL
jgi:hypothetical protein